MVGSAESPTTLTRLPETGLGGRRKRRPERHDEILVAAVARFATHGYHSSSVEDIAADVGVSATAIYRHFRNKQEILDTAGLWINALLAVRLLVGEAAKPAARLRQIVSNLVVVSLDHPDFVGLFVRELRSLTPEVHATCMVTRDAYLAEMCTTLRQTDPGLSAAEARARVDLVMALMCQITSVRDVDAFDAPRVVEAMAMAALRA